MVILTFPFPCQVKRVVAVGLFTYTRFTLINLPWLIPIPDSPMPISHMESLLEALSEAPLHRPIMNSELCVGREEGEVFNGEDGLTLLRPFYL